MNDVPAPLRDDPDILEKDTEYWEKLGFTLDVPQHKEEDKEDKEEEVKLTAAERKAIRRRSKQLSSLSIIMCVTDILNNIEPPGGVDVFKKILMVDIYGRFFYAQNETYKYFPNGLDLHLAFDKISQSFAKRH